jgi:transmembrane sensor
MEEMAKYLSGEMDDLQMSEYKAALDAEPEMAHELDQMKQFWDQMELLGSGEWVNTDQAWDSLNQRITSEAESIAKPGKILMMPALIKWAAAILIIAGLGWITYLAWAPEGQELLVFENHEEGHTSVKTLDDGSLVYLSGQAQIKYPGVFDKNERSVVISGEAYFDVAADPYKPFRIQAGVAEIEVVGTAFNVKTIDAENFELFVESGQVNVFFGNKRSNAWRVNAGQLLTMIDGQISMLESVDYNTLWRKDLISFKDESLYNILYVLGKTYGFSWRVDDEVLNHRRMTLAISDASVNTIGQLISLSLAIDHQLTADSVLVFRNRP